MSRTKLNFLADWRLYILVADIVRLHVFSRRPARSTTIRLPIYLLCDNVWVWLYACVISRLSGEPAYKLSIPKRWDAVLIFFSFTLLGLINLPRGGCDSFWHSSHFFPLRNLFPFPGKQLLSPQTNKLASSSAIDRLFVWCAERTANISFKLDK